MVYFLEEWFDDEGSFDRFITSLVYYYKQILAKSGYNTVIIL